MDQSYTPLFYKNTSNKPVVEIDINLLVPIMPPSVTDSVVYRNEERFVNLKADIKINGIKEPVVVKYNFLKETGKYTVLEGVHRYIIAKLLGHTTMKCVVVEGEIDTNGNVLPLKFPMGFMEISIDLIMPSLGEHDSYHSTELRKRIVNDGGAVKTPIEVVPQPDCRFKGKYLIKDGNHRYWIAKSLGYKSMMCKVLEKW